MLFCVLIFKATEAWAEKFPGIEINDGAVVFTTTVPAAAGNFSVETRFLRGSPTVEKDIKISQQRKILKGPRFNPDDTVRLRFVLDNGGRPFRQSIIKYQGRPMLAYDRPQDRFSYFQMPNDHGGVDLKEWILVRRPNCPQGSCYQWYLKGEDFNRRIVFTAGRDGINIQRQMIVQGIDPMDYAAQRHVIEAVRRALKKMDMHFAGEDILGQVKPVIYKTKEGVPKQGVINIRDHQMLEVTINEPPQNYPLLIDPGLELYNKKIK